MTQRAGAPILVLGATGRVGGATLRALGQRPEADRPPVRVLVRDPARLQAPLSCDVRIGGIEDRNALGSALNGAAAVLLVTPDHPRQPHRELAVVKAAADAGARIVKLSAFTAGLQPRVSFGRPHGQVEDAIERAGLAHTFLRPTFFFQSLELFAGPVLRSGRLIAPAGQGAVGFVDVDDVGAAAAAVLCEPGHDGRAYDLTGPAALRFGEVAEQLSAVVGRHVAHLNPPLFAARLAMGLGGMPWSTAGLLTELFAAIRRGAEAVVTDDLERLTGRPPASLATYLARAGSVWAGTAPPTRR